MAAITICSDIGASKKLKSATVSPSICHEVILEVRGFKMENYLVT